MVLKEDLLCHPYPTENLILKERRRHYRTCVAPAHWQLRALIGINSHDDCLYYPLGLNSQQIQRYNTSTNESSAFRLLTFIPRCTVVKNGWMCCGGENGQYVALRLDDRDISSDTDSTLPFDLDPHVNYQPGFLAILDRHRVANKNILAKSTKFGVDRINCVTMWFPPSGRGFAGAYQEPVSILANNDNTVTIVSLANSERIDKIITYPGCMNRALLSPDGQLLIAIGDDPYLYAHRRVETEGGRSTATDSDTAESANGKSYEWKECAKIKLKGQRNEDRSEYRGSFAACFNNTGQIVAVGTQYGMVCIFSTRAIIEGNNRSALLTCFTSTAPKSGPGAIRDMSFCPGSFDLLAWTEDRTTVCIADLRTNFTTRQVLKLTDEASFEHVPVHDRTTIDPRLLESNTDDIQPLLSNLANSTSGSAERRAITRHRESLADSSRHEYPTSNERERYDYPLTADETQVLEALQEHRRRRERRARGEITSVQDFLSSSNRTFRDAGDSTRTPLPGISRSPSNPDPIGSSRARASSASRNTSSSATARERSASVTRAVEDILGNIDTQRARIREAHDLLRINDESDRIRQENASQAWRLQRMQEHRMQARMWREARDWTGDNPREFARRTVAEEQERGAVPRPRPRMYARRSDTERQATEEQTPDQENRATYYFSRRLEPERQLPPSQMRNQLEALERENRQRQLQALEQENRTRLLARRTEVMQLQALEQENRTRLLARRAEVMQSSGSAPDESTPSASNLPPLRDAPRGAGSAWDAISSLYSLTLDNEGNITQSRDGAAEGENSTESRRDPLSLFNLVGQLQDPTQQHNIIGGDDTMGGMRRRMATMGGTRQGHERDETAGLTWSEDGTTLYVGAFDGIYEFHVNTFARKLFPSITMR